MQAVIETTFFRVMLESYLKAILVKISAIFAGGRKLAFILTQSRIQQERVLKLSLFRTLTVQ
jgi:hypothetical protein